MSGGLLFEDLLSEGLLSESLLSGGAVSRTFDFGSENPVIMPESLGVYSLRVYSLEL